jgi:hypothetical protein
MNIDKAVSAVGGLAYFARLSLRQQADAIGLQGSEPSHDVLQSYFGPASDGKKANALATQEPSEYARLRGWARLKKIQ